MWSQRTWFTFSFGLIQVFAVTNELAYREEATSSLTGIQFLFLDIKQTNSTRSVLCLGHTRQHDCNSSTVLLCTTTHFAYDFVKSYYGERYQWLLSESTVWKQGPLPRLADVNLASTMSTHPGISVQTVCHLTCLVTRRCAPQNAVEDVGRRQCAREHDEKPQHGVKGRISPHLVSLCKI